MPAPAFTLFQTPLGMCGIAWRADGIVGVQFPEANARETHARLTRHWPGARKQNPPPEVKDAINRILAVLSGVKDDLRDLKLDMSGVPDFHRRAYVGARAVPPGETIAYGELATKIGATGAARAVGGAMSRNPFAIVVPCHRVVAAGRKLGGFSAKDGVTTKLRLLAIEGVRLDEKKPLFVRDRLFDPAPARERG